MDMQTAYTYKAYLSHGSFPNVFSTYPTFAVGELDGDKPLFVDMYMPPDLAEF